MKQQGIKQLGITLGRSGRLSYNSKITLQLCHQLFPSFDESLVFWDCIDAEKGKQAGFFLKSLELMVSLQIRIWLQQASCKAICKIRHQW